jgi:hypothetical protein
MESYGFVQVKNVEHIHVQRNTGPFSDLVLLGLLFVLIFLSSPATCIPFIRGKNNFCPFTLG